MNEGTSVGVTNVMQLLLTDETNLTPSGKAEFFVTGGLVFPVEGLSALHAEISRIRMDCGYKPKDHLKFNTHARPSHVSQAKCTLAKNAVIDACARLKCRFIAYVVLHKIVGKNEKYIQWGLDAVIRSFDLYLQEKGENGIVIFDRPPIPKPHEYFIEKFSEGLKFPGTGGRVDLDRIKLFGSSCSNASHGSAAVDIVLGSFRYAINERNKPAAGLLMKKVVPMMWGERDGADYNVNEKGLILRPMLPKITVTNYRKKYDDLLEYVNKLVADLPIPS
jgi:hypothetical protein